MFAFTRGYVWGIRPIIRKPHIICAVILVNPCFIHVHDILPCFPKRFDLSQIITPIIDNRHLIVQNSSIITYFFTPVFKTGRIMVYTNVDCPFVRPFHMSRSNLRTPWPIHFKFHRVIGIDSLTVCILYGEILNFHYRVMGLYSSNCT